MSQANQGPNNEAGASNLNPLGTKKRKVYRERSEVWPHYDRYFEAGKPRALCKYCKTKTLCALSASGTSSLWGHLKKCSAYPNNEIANQAHLVFDTTKDELSGESNVRLLPVRFDQQRSRKAIAEMIIIDELPFKFIENEGFKRCMKICQPTLVIPSRTTITRDCYKLFLEEKAKLKSELKNSTLRVCLTTDTWTSLQRINYMCLTAHYIDANWKLQKKVINFCPITSHRGHDIGKAVENCLIEWDLRNVLTITVDNASSNDTAIEYLKAKLVKWGDRCILQGKWTHIRCVAHIMNLIVQDGLKDMGGSIDRVRGAVRWVRLSGARLKRFKEFAVLDEISCQKSLCLDVPTRWNSTYLMLSVAIEYEKDFDRLSEEDYVFLRDLQEGNGVPDSDDWSNMRRLVVFLWHFYELTLRVSGTKYITSNTYLDSINCVDNVLKRCFASEDVDLKGMAVTMMAKFAKYWGVIKKFNLLVFIAAVFDPRTKLEYVKVTLRGMYGLEGGEKVGNLCENELTSLSNDYKRIYSFQSDVCSSSHGMNTHASTSKGSSNSSLFDSSDDTLRAIREKTIAEVKRLKAESGVEKDSKTELDRYLKKEIEGDAAYFERDDFSVLAWWKKRSPTFPILSLVARDILAIPISTVASESTFSTGGRVLDSFRSSLTPQTAEALVCFQDWIWPRNVPVQVEEHIEDAERIEEDIRAASSQSPTEET